MSNEAPTDALRLVPFETIEAQAEAWSDRVEIQHMVEMTSAVFAKWASPEILSRFRQQMMAVIQQAYIEGAAGAAPASPLPEGGWQDISTAPKDGTWIVGFVPGPQPEVTPICWESGQDDFGKNGWCGAGSGYGGVLYEVHNVLDAQPTHWVPLPAAPTGEARNGKGEG